MEEINKESSLQPENISEKKLFWQNLKRPVAVTTKTKILIGILVVLVSAGGVLAWRYKWTSEYKISPIRILQKLQCYKINKEFYSKLKELNKSCQSNEDCKIASLGAGLCINKDEDITREDITRIEEFKSYMEDKCYKLEGEPVLYPIQPVNPVYRCECENNICKEIRLKEVLSQQEVTIITDEAEYEQGEIVKITVKNNTEEEKEICSPFYIVENFDGKKWIEIKKVLCPCEVVCRLATYLALQPNKPAEYEWNQKEEWCSDPSKISTTISNQVPSGRYRVKSYIGAMKGECKEIYSNEFRIKGK